MKRHKLKILDELYALSQPQLFAGKTIEEQFNVCMMIGTFLLNILRNEEEIEEIEEIEETEEAETMFLQSNYLDFSLFIGDDDSDDEVDSSEDDFSEDEDMNDHLAL